MLKNKLSTIKITDSILSNFYFLYPSVSLSNKKYKRNRNNISLDLTDSKLPIGDIYACTDDRNPAQDISKLRDEPHKSAHDTVTTTKV